MMFSNSIHLPANDNIRKGFNTGDLMLTKPSKDWRSGESGVILGKT
jgi:hypothetical protein